MAKPEQLIMKPIPEQYKGQAEKLICEIGYLVNKLYPILTELGESAEIECDKCLVIIKKKDNAKPTPSHG